MNTLKTTVAVAALSALILGLARAAHAQNQWPLGPNGNASPFGGRDVGGGPPANPGETWHAVPRPGGTVETYGPNGEHIIAVPHNCPGCGVDYYRIR